MLKYHHHHLLKLCLVVAVKHETVADWRKFIRRKLNSFWHLNLIYLNIYWKGLGYLGQSFSSVILRAVKCHDSATVGYVKTLNDCPGKVKWDLNHWEAKADCSDRNALISPEKQHLLPFAFSQLIGSRVCCCFSFLMKTLVT